MNTKELFELVKYIRTIRKASQESRQTIEYDENGGGWIETAYYKGIVRTCDDILDKIYDIISTEGVSTKEALKNVKS